MSQLTDKELLQEIRHGGDDTLRVVYEKYREPCLRFLLGRIIRKEEPNRRELADELFTEMLIIFVNNARTGRLTELTARIDTYLNAIGRNLYLKYQRKGRENYRNPSDLPTALVSPAIDPDGDLERQILYARMRELGPRCRQLLAHFYFLGLDWQSISEILGYKNADSAKTNKSKCMVRLRALYGITKKGK